MNCQVDRRVAVKKKKLSFRLYCSGNVLVCPTHTLSQKRAAFCKQLTGSIRLIRWPELGEQNERVKTLHYTSGYEPFI